MTNGFGECMEGWLRAAIVAGGLAGAVQAQDAPLERFEYRQLGMGVEARLVMYAESEDQAFEAAKSAYARLREIEWATSDYIDDGPVAELSRSAPEVVWLPKDLEKCLILSGVVSSFTGEAFRGDAAPVTHLWREARRAGQLPSEQEVEVARETTAESRLIFRGSFLGDMDDGHRVRRDDGRTAYFTTPGGGLDLGGIAKGYAADEMLEELRELGLRIALVDVGGDVALGDAPPGSDGWSILAGSLEEGRGAHLELSNCGVATSGATEQFLEGDDRRFSHIVDPRTGWALSHPRVVTVVQHSAAFADGLASAFSVMTVSESEEVTGWFEGNPEMRVIVEHPDSRPIFDGESLDGWTTTGGRYDGGARWTVEDGELVGRTGENGEGGLIYTDSFHSAFELELEVRMDYPYDSGVFTNMLPPDSGLKGLQVTLDHRPGGEIAGVYADGWLEHNPDGEQLFERDAWNRVRVRQTGFDPRVEVWINDRKALDYQLPADAEGFARHGRIGLQVHGADAEAASRSVRFRNVFLRELPVLGEGWATENPTAAADVLMLTEAAGQEGWADLLSLGMDGFEARGTQEGYEITKGVLHVPADGGGQLATASDHADFAMTMEFELARMGNSGLYLRSARDGQNPSYQGYEVQIIDDFNWERETESTLVDYQKTGGLYAVHPPLSIKPYREPGQWNRMEVLARGQRIGVALNGLILYDLDLATAEAEPPTDERPTTGFLGVQRYGAPSVEGDWSLRVRNWFVRDLDLATAKEVEPADGDE